jgi:hypothetical protein
VTTSVRILGGIHPGTTLQLNSMGLLRVEKPESVFHFGRKGKGKGGKTGNTSKGKNKGKTKGFSKGPQK